MIKLPIGVTSWPSRFSSIFRVVKYAFFFELRPVCLIWAQRGASGRRQMTSAGSNKCTVAFDLPCQKGEGSGGAAGSASSRKKLARGEGSEGPRGDCRHDGPDRRTDLMCDDACSLSELAFEEDMADASASRNLEIPRLSRHVSETGSFSSSGTSHSTVVRDEAQTHSGVCPRPYAAS